MTALQSVISIIYLFLTASILVSQHIYKDETPTSWLILIARSSMVFPVIFLLGSSPSPLVPVIPMIITFIITVVADYFFINKNNAYGIIGFTIAYLILAYSFGNHFNLLYIAQMYPITYLLPFLLIFLCVFFHLQRYVTEKKEKIGTMIFGLSLSVSSWILTTTIHRDFSYNVSMLTFVAGITLFISDMLVAYSVFYPSFKEKFICWLENIIWATYMLGWTLLILTFTI